MQKRKLISISKKQKNTLETNIKGAVGGLMPPMYKKNERYNYDNFNT